MFSASNIFLKFQTLSDFDIWSIQLKWGTPVISAFENFHTNFGFYAFLFLSGSCTTWMLMWSDKMVAQENFDYFAVGVVNVIPIIAVLGFVRTKASFKWGGGGWRGLWNSWPALRP